jgi:hypothetical protein
MGIFDYSEYGPLYQALAGTPAYSMIAGHPQLLDNIPVFAKRPAFATFELAHPWSKGLWARLKPRLDDLFVAYYAEDPETVREFCLRYGVRFWVVDDRHYAPAFLEDRPFFAPFDEAIRAMVQGRTRFALLTERTFPREKINDHVQIVEIAPARRGSPELFPTPRTGDAPPSRTFGRP